MTNSYHPLRVSDEDYDMLFSGSLNVIKSKPQYKINDILIISKNPVKGSNEIEFFQLKINFVTEDLVILINL